MTDMAGMTMDIVGPGSVIAAKMAAEDFGGKVGARSVEILAGDHQHKPDVGAALARKWFDTEGVDVIVDLPNSSAALAVQEDFLSFLLQAQASKAKVMGMANAGADTILTMKQAAEFGITGVGRQLVASYINISEVHAVGLKASQGVQLVDTAYCDSTDDMRAWSRRFFERHRRMPTSLQADVYSAVTHHLKAVQTADPSDGTAVVKAMKAMTINGPVLNNAFIREDGRVVRDYCLFRVKSPEESKGPWDHYKLEQTIPGEQLLRPVSESECPLVRKT
ncbi:MAG: ABC transporter substrate-binding protein [Rhizobacter sp.]|nr:ABC transporter substrate-binding protein [Rhizobacter sp.]